MNYKVRHIISQLKHASIKHTLSYHSIFQSKDDKYLEYMIKKSLYEQLARFLIEAKPQTTQVDTPEGRAYRLDLFAFSYHELVKLLEDTYTQGQLDYPNRYPSPTKFDDPSNIKT